MWSSDTSCSSSPSCSSSSTDSTPIKRCLPRDRFDLKCSEVRKKTAPLFKPDPGSSSSSCSESVNKMSKDKNKKKKKKKEKKNGNQKKPGIKKNKKKPAKLSWSELQNKVAGLSQPRRLALLKTLVPDSRKKPPKRKPQK